PFENKPDVVVGLSMIDAAPGNLRYSIKTKSISRDGFTVEVKTWGDTKIMSIGGFWVAHAEASTGSDY
ncbi:MAG: H-type lectin domain-containing protein, partial [Ignavibacteriaceae bacterium]